MLYFYVAVGFMIIAREISSSALFILSAIMIWNLSKKVNL